MWDLIVEYFKANPVILGVVCGAILLIVIAIVALCVKGAKAKKNIQAIPAPTQMPVISQTDNSPTAINDEQASIEPIPAEQENQPTDTQENGLETAQASEEQPVDEPATAPVKESKKKSTATAEKTTEKTATKSTPTPKKAESFKKAMQEKTAPAATVTPTPAPAKPVTPAPVYEEDETETVAKYSGKWVLCRVLSADETDAKQTEELYFFELRASNGERLLSSEEYTSYNGALGGIATHKANILKDNFRITLSKKGDYIFKLMSGKNMLLCMGEHYATRARCESAIESTKRFAKTAIIDENIQDIIVTPPKEDDGDVAPPAEGYNGKWIVSSNVDADGEEVYYFELFASNGEKLLSSEEYTTYVGAINGIGTHKANIQKGNFRITLTKHGDYIYKLLSGNGQLLCLGEHYKTKRRCLSAVESVKRFALNAPVLTDSKNAN